MKKKSDKSNKSDKLDKLKKWLGINDLLELSCGESRGLFTLEPIQKNKIIIKIKSKYLIEYQSICEKFKIDGLMCANSLVAYYLVILHFNKDKEFEPYLDILPDDIENFMLCWKKKDLDDIKYTSLGNIFEENMFDDNNECNYDYEYDYDYDAPYETFYAYEKAIENDYWLIYQYNCENKIINIADEEFYSQWIKFRLLVGSRIFGYEKYGENKSGLIPYVDMINHSDNNTEETNINSSWYFDDKQDAFVLVSTRDIRKNEEITDSYGVKTNCDLLLYYGFTLKNISNPVVRIGIYENEKKIYLELGLENTLKDITNKFSKSNSDNIIKRLKHIYEHHREKLSIKTGLNKITNQNIANIYEDEIRIISHILGLKN